MGSSASLDCSGRVRSDASPLLVLFDPSTQNLYLILFKGTLGNCLYQYVRRQNYKHTPSKPNSASLLCTNLPVRGNRMTSYVRASLPSAAAELQTYSAKAKLGLAPLYQSSRPWKGNDVIRPCQSPVRGGRLQTYSANSLLRRCALRSEDAKRLALRVECSEYFPSNELNFKLLPDLTF